MRRRFVLVSDTLTLLVEFIAVALVMPRSLDNPGLFLAGLITGSFIGSLLTLIIQRLSGVRQDEPIPALIVNRWLGAFATAAFIAGLILLSFKLLLAAVLPLIGLGVVSLVYHRRNRPAA